ncbi:MAG: hypothetical protein JWM09_1506, partial [Francisellaceae bacterium]|nr:hypothetical protein [Francisellaceae bacterium]
AEICTQFPDLAPSYRSLFKKASSHEDPEGEHPFSELLNGSGCSKWFNLMEYNFNKAAGFSQDYKQYTRIINVLWKGNEGAANFSKAIDNAKFHGSNECGLISLLRQLYTAQIETNIVAHSLGSAFLLQALEQLGQSKEKLVNKVILWQAAIPKTIFTNDKSHYHDTRLNSRFPHIFNACQSINVLFSEKDLVLKLLYPLSQYLPYSLEEILNFSTQKVHQKIIPVWKALFIEEIANHLQNTVQILKLSEAQIQDLFKEIAETAYLTSGLLATQDYNPILVMVRQASYYEFQWTTRFSKEFIWRSNPENPPALNEYYHNIGLDEGVYRPLPEIRHHSHEYLEKIKNYNERARKAKYTFAKAAYKTLLIVEKRFSAEGALGYKGADWTPYIDRLEKSKTLLQVNQKDYLAGHSYMKRPTEALMEEIYKKFVIGPKGIIRFGKYPIKK